MTPRIQTENRPEKKQRGRPKSQFKESSAGSLQSLDRALMLLSTVARRTSATLSDLAREADIPTATTHRLLPTLRDSRYVTFDEERQEWRIGIEAYRTGLSFLSRTSVAEVGRPVMRRLMQETGETANLAVPDMTDSGAEVVFIGQVETPNPIRAFFPPGTRTSMHASGTGKAILAALSPEARARAFARLTFDAYTASTLASPALLAADLDRTATRGWSHDHEERHPGMSCIGAAIHDDQGHPCAGISVSGPTARFAADRAGTLGRAVADAAREITELSGGRWPPPSADT